MAVELTIEETKLITGEELAAMSGVELTELIDGRIVPMAPTGDEHAIYELKISARLLAFVEAKGLGKVGTGEAGIYIRRNPDTIRAADVYFISNERYMRKKSKGFLDVAPDLVVEILSPGDAWSDVTQKLRDYFSIGVRLIWVVDPQTRSVYAYRSITDVREFTSNDDLPGDDVLPGFSVKVTELFEI